ncbi:MAG: hypothetical protein K6G18_10960, partial [Treponema sp.]|nr:hypothetical protein [Treponema sp.]
MKKSNGIGPTARSFRRGICLAAFTLAIVSLIPACKSGSGDETEDLPTYTQMGQAGQADIKSTEAPTQVAANPKTADSSTQGPAATQLATAPVATDTAPQSPEAAQPGPEGQQELAAQAPATQDPAVLTDAGNQQNGADPQEQAVI